jgi:protein-disulfide isomerase
MKIGNFTFGRLIDKEPGIEEIFPRFVIASNPKNTPALVVKSVYSNDFVFTEATTLLTVDWGSSRGLCRVTYCPQGFTLPGEKELSAKPAALHVSLNDSKFTYPLPELTVNANYRQVTAMPQYKAVVESISASPASMVSFDSIGFKGFKRILIRTAKIIAWAFVALFVLVLFLGVTGGNTTQHSSAPQSAVPSAKESTAQTERLPDDQLNAAERATVRKVVAESGIQLHATGKPFVIFSDPNCPACRQLEAQLNELAKTDKSFAPIIVPVAFKKNSEEAVTQVLCSKDMVAAWRLSVVDTNEAASANSLCDDGKAKVALNNAAFAALRLDKTPTIITTNGKVAVGAKDFKGLMQWIKENSNG